MGHPENARGYPLLDGESALFCEGCPADAGVYQRRITRVCTSSTLPRGRGGVPHLSTKSESDFGLPRGCRQAVRAGVPGDLKPDRQEPQTSHATGRTPTPEAAAAANRDATDNRHNQEEVKP